MYFTTQLWNSVNDAIKQLSVMSVGVYSLFQLGSTVVKYFLCRESFVNVYSLFSLPMICIVTKQDTSVKYFLKYRTSKK